jgi:hypothetical protein
MNPISMVFILYICNIILLTFQAKLLLYRFYVFVLDLSISYGADLYLDLRNVTKFNSTNILEMEPIKNHKISVNYAYVTLLQW